MELQTKTQQKFNYGWVVTSAGIGINLALGFIYSWSIFKSAIKTEFAWNATQLNDPYALCCLVYAFTMVGAGFCQDKIGPRITTLMGGLLVGAGLFICSTSTDYWTWMVGFGVLTGMGIACGYASVTPAALKWFPSSKTGLISGLVVSGFALSSVYIAPLSEYLLTSVGLRQTMFFYSIAFTIAICALSLLLTNPPATHTTQKTSSTTDSTPGHMLRTPMFYLLWAIYFIAAGAGLMVISSMSCMAKHSMGTHAFVAVIVLALGNAAGRIVAGIFSDVIGRKWTLMIVLLSQAALMFAAIPLVGSHTTAPFVILLVATAIGFNYGANLCLFPALTKDFWGLKSFGINYGLVITAWGIGGFTLSRVQQILKAQSGNFTSSFIC